LKLLIWIGIFFSLHCSTLQPFWAAEKRAERRRKALGNSWSCPRLFREQQQPASHINKSPSESDLDLDWERATLTPSAHLAINLEKRGQVGAPVLEAIPLDPKTRKT